MLIQPGIYVNVEPFDLAKYPVGPTESNHVAFTIVCSGSRGYILEFGPIGEIETGQDRAILFESGTLDGVVTLTHLSAERMEVGGLDYAGGITTLFPCSSASLTIRINELWSKYNHESYKILGTQYGDYKNCRDFARMVLINLTSTDDVANHAPPSIKWDCIVT